MTTVAVFHSEDALIAVPGIRYTEFLKIFQTELYFPSTELANVRFKYCTILFDDYCHTFYIETFYMECTHLYFSKERNHPLHNKF
jgi:hypothetical protein